jgi:4-amino-4-deoxy-L-arabinose transferase-like glycosyltransferase
MTESVERENRWLARLAPWLLVGGMVLFHAGNNWVWLVDNVTMTGWDKPRHLARSLSYTHTLSPITVESLFEVMTSDPVRPPLFPVSAGLMYKLFGTTADVATMVNILYMAIALAATYGIGQRWGGRRLGLISVALLAVFPMFYSMSRYFYLEFALTAMVTLTVYLLLATDGFRRRGTSLLFGLSLGLGLLTKRTFALFAVGPVIVAILTSGLLPALWQRLRQWFDAEQRRGPRILWKNALVALVGGSVPAAIWYLPNREAIQTLILGDALFVCWWALAALTIYFGTLPAAPLANALAAFFLAAGLASTWYLGRIEFLERVALYGYGVDDPRGRTLQLTSVDTYVYYLRKLGNEHLSLAIFVVLAAVLVAAMVVFVRKQGSVGRALRKVRPAGWTVLAWAGGAYVLLTLSIYQETRAFTPALPGVALISGAVLLKLPWRRLRLGLLALILAFGLLQFAVLSYEPVQRLLPPTTFRLALWGQTSSFAQGVYIQLPDEGRTDRAFWIEPDVLQRMEERRLALGHDLLSLGLLVNMSQINAGSFDYLILTEYPHLRVESLIERFEETSPYRRLFAHDYVAVKRTNTGMNPAQEEVIEALLEGPPRLFAQAFELETTYAMPYGDTVYLYRQRTPLPDDYPIQYVSSLAEDISGRTRAGDTIVLVPPDLVGPFVSHYTGSAEITLTPPAAEAEDELAAIASEQGRVYLVVGEGANGKVEDWLNRHAFRAAHEWADSLQLITYGTVDGVPAPVPAVELDVVLDGRLELTGYDLPAASWQGGDIVPLTLFWQVQAPVGNDYGVFIHLLDGSGGLVAQADSAPVGGSRPTSGWEAGEEIVDRHGLLLPDGLAAGEYELRMGMYVPASGERLLASSANGQRLGDSLSLGWVEVAP